MAERLPPHDIDAEEAAVGSLLIDGAAIRKIDFIIQPADFYSERNRWIFESCIALYQRDERINQITIAQELARQEKLESCGGAAYLSHLISVCPTSLDVEYYAQIVFRLAVMRRLINAADQIADIGFKADPDIDAGLDKAEDLLYNLRHGKSPRDFVHIREILDKYLETEAPADEDGQPSPLVRVPSGFVGVDEFLGGFQRSDLVIVAGRPSMGKTSFALNVARNAAVSHNACIAMFSLEMSRESLVERLLASEASINPKKIRLGSKSQTPEDEKRIMDATGILSEAPIYIDDSPQMRIAEMRSKAKRLHFEHELNLIIVDHLGLIQGDGRNENRVQEISYITRQLKVLARELNVPVIAVSQLSRAAEWRASHKPQLSDLRDSGSIEQDADVVLFIYRDEYYYRTEEDWFKEHPDEQYPKGIAEIIVAKHRNGPTGEVKLKFIHELTKFENQPLEESSSAIEQSML
jgi:replicative DNA helicase